MKVLLIQPNSNPFLVGSIPLGLLYLASSLRNAGGHTIMIVDTRRCHWSDQDLHRQIKEFSPEVVGISGLSIQAKEIHRLALLVKGADLDCKVVIGGAYASASPEFIINDPHVDFVVVGEGERAVCSLVDSLANDKNVSKISGLVFKDGDKRVVNSPVDVITDLDTIPFPAWDLIDMEGYFNDGRRHSENPIPASGRIVPIFTSRGCPYRCVYCHNIFGKKIRFRSVENVLEEMERLVNDYAVEEIEVVDDCFNFDLGRAKQICDEMIRRGIAVHLSFPNGLRVDRMDEELVEKLKKAGTHMLYYAIESGSPEVQRRIKKDLDLEKARRLVRYTAQRGIVTGGFFMFGFPHETREQMLQTVRFAKEMPFHIADFFYVTPRPNTRLFEELKEMNLGVDHIEKGDYQRLSFNASAVSDAELKNIWAKAFREFYFRPSQMLRIWRMVPNKRVLLQKTFRVLKRCFSGTAR
ncbi:B12-binding domain-containing radical SAM protein [Candidatus Omnitrophota bacterium]